MTPSMPVRLPTVTLLSAAGLTAAFVAATLPGCVTSADVSSPGIAALHDAGPADRPASISPENEKTRLRREAWQRAVAGIAFDERIRIVDPIALDETAVAFRRDSGAIAMETNRHTDAIGFYVEVVRARPDRIDAYLDLAAALVAKGRVSEARATFATALDLGPGNTTALRGLAEIAAWESRLDDAVALMNRALDADPGLAEAHARLAAWTLALGDVDAARAHADRAGDAVAPQLLALLDGVSSAPALGSCAPLVIGPQQRIDAGGTFASNETTAASSEINPDCIIAGWNDWRLSGASEVINSGFAMTTDGGATWTDSLVRPPAPYRSSVEGDPMAAADPRTGALWAGAISFAGNGGIYVARKDPGASSFNASVMAYAGAGADKCWMVAGPRPGEPDSTRLYIAFNYGVIRSDDMGDTWSPPVSIGSGIGWLPRIGPDGELYVLGWDFGTGLILKRSLDGGLSFTQHTMATRMDTWPAQDGSRFPGTFRTPALGYFDVDENTGELFGIFYDRTSFDGVNHNIDLYWTTSADQGSTWTTPRLVNDVTIPGDQFFTWIEIDDAGVLHLVFLDSRHTDQFDGQILGYFDAYYAFSADRGETWTEARLTPESWGSNDDGLDRTLQFIGDYLSLTVSGGVAWPVYLDTSNGDPDIMTNAVRLGVVGDATGDGAVDVEDLLLVLADWGSCPEPCGADVDCDGMVGVLDLLLVLASWSD